VADGALLLQQRFAVIFSGRFPVAASGKKKGQCDEK
jgi:hypothetical protein